MREGGLRWPEFQMPYFHEEIERILTERGHPAAGPMTEPAVPRAEPQREPILLRSTSDLMERWNLDRNHGMEE